MGTRRHSVRGACRARLLRRGWLLGIAVVAGGAPAARAGVLIGHQLTVPQGPGSTLGDVSMRAGRLVAPLVPRAGDVWSALLASRPMAAGSGHGTAAGSFDGPTTRRGDLLLPSASARPAGAEETAVTPVAAPAEPPSIDAAGGATLAASRAASPLLERTPPPVEPSSTTPGARPLAESRGAPAEATTTGLAATARAAAPSTAFDRPTRAGGGAGAIGAASAEPSRPAGLTTAPTPATTPSTAAATNPTATTETATTAPANATAPTTTSALPATTTGTTPRPAVSATAGTPAATAPSSTSSAPATAALAGSTTSPSTVAPASPATPTPTPTPTVATPLATGATSPAAPGVDAATSLAGAAAHSTPTPASPGASVPASIPATPAPATAAPATPASTPGAPANGPATPPAAAAVGAEPRGPAPATDAPRGGNLPPGNAMPGAGGGPAAQGLPGTQVDAPARVPIDRASGGLAPAITGPSAGGKDTLPTVGTGTAATTAADAGLTGLAAFDALRLAAMNVPLALERNLPLPGLASAAVAATDAAAPVSVTLVTPGFPAPVPEPTSIVFPALVVALALVDRSIRGIRRRWVRGG